MLNPFAIFKLEQGTEVEVLEDGSTYTASHVSVSEYTHYGTDEEHAGLDRLGADGGYEVRMSDANAIIPEDAVVDIISVEDL